MMPSLASLMIIVMILDTGQSQDNCRDISDGCSCPRPNHLRCKIGEKHDFKGILEQIEENNITTFDVTLTNLTILEPEVFKNTQSLSALVISLSQLKVSVKKRLYLGPIHFLNPFVSKTLIPNLYVSRAYQKMHLNH